MWRCCGLHAVVATASSVLNFAKCAPLFLPQGSLHLVICDSDELSRPATPYLSTRCHKSLSADSHIRDIPRPVHIPKSFFPDNTPASHDFICHWSEYTKLTSPFLWTIFHLVNMYSCFSNPHMCQILCLLPALPLWICLFLLTAFSCLTVSLFI